MENIILIAVLIGLVGSASCYIYKAKKKGETCIGCPHAKMCHSHKCAGSCSGNRKDTSRRTSQRDIGKS